MILVSKLSPVLGIQKIMNTAVTRLVIANFQVHSLLKLYKIEAEAQPALAYFISPSFSASKIGLKGGHKIRSEIVLISPNKSFILVKISNQCNLREYTHIYMTLTLWDGEGLFWQPPDMKGPSSILGWPFG